LVTTVLQVANKIVTAINVFIVMSFGYYLSWLLHISQNLHTLHFFQAFFN